MSCIFWVMEKWVILGPQLIMSKWFQTILPTSLTEFLLKKFATLGLSRKNRSWEKRFGIRDFSQLFPPLLQKLQPCLVPCLCPSLSPFLFPSPCLSSSQLFPLSPSPLAFSTVSASRLCFFFAGLPAKITLYDNTIKISRETRMSQNIRVATND